MQRTGRESGALCAKMGLVDLRRGCVREGVDLDNAVIDSMSVAVGNGAIWRW